MEQRLHYLDRLKVWMTALVVLHHTAIAYGGAGNWYYSDPGGTELADTVLTLFTVVNQSFFMGLFFFISGYMTPASYDRKGAARLLRDRLSRYGVPVILYMAVVSPVVTGISQGFNGSLPTYVKEVLVANSLRGIAEFETGPTWFLVALLLFNGGYILFRLMSRRLADGQPGGLLRRSTGSDSLRFLRGSADSRPLRLSPTVLAGYLLAVAAANYLVRLAYPVGETFLSLQLGYFPAYIALYYGGAAAYRGQWLERLTSRSARKWAGTAAGVVALLPVIMALGGAMEGRVDLFYGGGTWQSAVYAAADPLLGLGISYVLLVRFRDRLGGPPGRAAWTAGAAFAAYVLHPLVVTSVCYGLRGAAFDPLLKFAIAGAAAVPLAFAAGWAIRLVPGARRIL